MTTVESGGYISNSGAQYGYVRIEYTITTTDTEVQWSASVYLRTTGSVVDSSNSWSLGGASGSNRPVSIGSGGGTYLMGSASGSTARQYGSSSTQTVTGSIAGIDVFSGSGLGSTSFSYSVPARAYNAPAAPTGCAVARTSDTSHTVTWTNTSPTSTSAPYQNVEVYRSTDGGAYARVATLGVVQSWTDTTTSADHSYRYKVRATNSGGASAYSGESAIAYTTPAAPGTPTAAKSGADIVLTFTNAARHDSGIKVYESQNGGAFALLATVAGADLTTWTHVAPSTAVTHAYKVTTTVSGLESAQSAASNTVQLLAAPNAPTPLAPVAVVDAAEAIVFSWQHNPVDTTAQTAYELRYRLAPSGAYTTLTGTTATTRTLAAGTLANGQTYEWQARTKGSHVDFGPWSALVSFPTSARPTAAISAPGATWASSVLDVAWAYYDAEGTAQAGWTAKLYDAAGALLENLSGVGTASTARFATRLADATTYRVDVQVQDGAGLWSLADAQTFTVSYAKPPVPAASVLWDPDTGTATVMVDNPDGAVAVVSNSIYRSINGGPEVLVADDVPPDGSATDRLPAYGQGTVNTYRVVAYSALPSTATSAPVDLEVDLGACEQWIWLNAGPGYAVSARVRGSLGVSVARDRPKVLRRFVGRTLPVEFMGPHEVQVVTLSGALQGLDRNDEAAFVEVARSGAPVVYRDPWGRRLFTSMGAVDFEQIGGPYLRVRTTLTEVDHAEAS